MAETAQEYIQRILGNLGGKNALKTQAETPRQLARLLQGAAVSKLRKRPAPDKWSVGEILAHLAESEIVVSWRVRAILGAPGTSIQSFDQDAWVAAGHYAQRHPLKSMEQFHSLREANLELYNSLDPGQWKHHGMHAERGKETVEHIVRLMAGHDINHAKQIASILRPRKENKRASR
jgi:hypothetical protein